MIERRTLLKGVGAVAALSFLGQIPALASALTEDDIFLDEDAPVLGNPDGDVTMAEYFDYQCGYCKAVHADVMSLVEEDGNIKLLMKDWPIFGDASIYAAQAVLGAAQIGQYEPAMEALITAKGRLTKTYIKMRLESAGVDMDAVAAAVNANSGKISGLLDRNYQQAVGLRFRGTPSFIIGTTVYPGAMDRDAMKRAVEAARKA
ncbi:DsbA family protein [Agrobacterium sp. ES01]|uniref:DsbA family protein n=1 Tax=Agrobacterium sp. ES01 TaxID=3420714 RepID=UPI003D0A5180